MRFIVDVPEFMSQNYEVFYFYIVKYRNPGKIFVSLTYSWDSKRGDRKWDYRSTWRSWIHALWYNYENKQQDALYRLIYYSKSAVNMSGDFFTHHQEHLTVFTVSGSVHPSVYTPHNLHSSVSTHSGHQPAATWVNTTRYCKYNQVFLTMGENIARNMYIRLGIINKSI
jgi:hypothetical protein